MNYVKKLRVNCPTGMGSPLISKQQSEFQVNIFSNNRDIRLDIFVQRTWMPPPSALSKLAPWLRYWLLSGNYRSIIKADLYNIEETNEGPCRSTRLAFSFQSNLDYEYEKTCFHHCLFTA